MPAARGASKRNSPATTAEELRPAARRRINKGGQIVDKFALPDSVLADAKARGMSLEWKRETAAGASDPSYDIFLREQGWEPVDGKRYAELTMKDHTGPLRREGQVLMERPIELTQEAMLEDKMAAREAVAVKEQQLHGAGAGEFQRHRADGSSTVAINRTVERGLPIE
jgi:hypothetical protein